MSSRNKNEAAAEALGYLTVLLLVTPVMVIWSGYALAVAWGWFVVAALHVPPLTVPAAIGIALVVRFMTWQDTTNDEPPAERLVGQIFMGLIKPALILGFGWVVHQFM